ncbi:T-cell immunoglobulin and mucin domain-containing protein 4 isoform X1 [Megalops cyprinoides]|uniref:T-cell immunoglobulin and mucin domain-containing protein 4 isoform X1 n=1 Tax=Megalops cyprinoides TaxID=118141 RepID=UPI0018647868|nr:T-cell immunoglobulin and mucin domain-containing protein 4 isoform X1 [Megalops cyprinoides]
MPIEAPAGPGSALLAATRTERCRLHPDSNAPTFPSSGMATRGGSFRLRWVLVLTISAAAATILALEVTEGGYVSLSCRYSVKRYGLSRVCWGRGCGTLWCSDILAQTDGTGVISKVSDKYRVTGDVLSGQVDLIIPRVNRMDSGPYCCRVDIDGYFNDKKVVYTLRVVKAPAVTTMPTPTAPPTPEPHIPTDPVWEEESSHLDVSKRNSSLKSGSVEEKPIPSLSLQVNIPVLSLSLSLLLVLLLGSLALLGFKRKIHRRFLKRGSLSTLEPRHIIYEIQTRRPVEENIYTLD